MTDITAAVRWHYMRRGKRHGPVSESELLRMIANKELEPDVRVWHAGLIDWVPVQWSSLVSDAKVPPPPIPGDEIGNGYVLIVAFMPLVLLLVLGVLLQIHLQDCIPNTFWTITDLCFVTFDPSAQLWPWALGGAAASSFFCFLDERRVRKAGYSTNFMLFIVLLSLLVLLLVPVYLFVRAKRVRQTPWYGLVWLGLFVLLLFA